MAKRGTVKRRSVEQEDSLAFLYRGRRSPSSGAHDEIDVFTDATGIEAKFQGGPGEKEATGYRIKLTEMEKIVDAARKTGREGAIAIRLYAPNSPLANVDGNVDMIVRLVPEDAARENEWIDNQITIQEYGESYA